MEEGETGVVQKLLISGLKIIYTKKDLRSDLRASAHETSMTCYRLQCDYNI